MGHSAEMFTFSAGSLERIGQARHQVLQLSSEGKVRVKCRFWCLATNAMFVQANVEFFALEQCPLNVLGCPLWSWRESECCCRSQTIQQGKQQGGVTFLRAGGGCR